MYIWNRLHHPASPPRRFAETGSSAIMFHCSFTVCQSNRRQGTVSMQISSLKITKLDHYFWNFLLMQTDVLSFQKDSRSVTVNPSNNPLYNQSFLNGPCDELFSREPPQLEWVLNN